jgi:NAD(P)H-hydrate repair Nnr-like enzyme with NAD(P)H-hydrate dehydratase domain
MTWACHASSGEIDYTILVEGQSTTAIRSVRAVVTLPAGSGDVLAGMFLGSVAALSYVGAEPEKARAWVRDHVSTGGRTAIGAINFTASGGPQNRTLDIVAAGSASP